MITGYFPPSGGSGSGVSSVNVGIGLAKTGTAASPTLALTAAVQTSLAKADSVGTAGTRNVGTNPGDVVEVASNGKILPAVLPAIAITDTFVVNSEAAMLALAAGVGDVAVRTDVNKSFILQADPASTLSNWQEILTAYQHEHTNKIVLDSLSEVGGVLAYKGVAVDTAGDGGSGAPAFVGVRVTNSAAITLTTAVQTTLTFNTERYDTNSMHDPTTNNDRLVCTVAGYYVISAQVLFSGASSSGYRTLNIVLNGATNIANRTQTAVASPSVTAITIDTIPIYLNIGDYVQLKATQNSGGNLDIQVSGMQSPEFGMYKVG